MSLLLQRVGEVARRLHLARRTIDCYQEWIDRFLRFCRAEDGTWRHPRELGADDVGAFLSHLACDRRASASTQNQATCAVVFLYKQVLADELGEHHLGRFEFERARRSVRVPTVLSTREVSGLVESLKPRSVQRLMVELLYGCGLRVMECCTLRLRDLDFDRGQILVRGGKGDKDRVVMLPGTLQHALAEQSRRVRALHERDLSRDAGYVPLPDPLAHKAPYAARDWRWQYVFPSARMRREPDGRGYRWHATPGPLDRVVRGAAQASVSA